MNGVFSNSSTKLVQNRSMPVFVIAHLDFGYPWWLSYGHLLILACMVAALFLGKFLKWSKWPMMFFGAIAIWSGVSFLMMHFQFDVNAKASMPTQNFLRSGSGRVIDLGAGTGRSSIMVLEARPQATMVATDLFAASFDSHFGPGQSPQQRLLANLKDAGVDQRATIETADMRKLPFPVASFDAAVSAYAIDHLGREGIGQALAETARVVKPGGEFLMMVIAKDWLLQFTFGPLLMHGGPRTPDWWTGRIKDAGFQILEQGNVPGTLYVLARRS